jgi:hypothetical protein
LEIKIAAMETEPDDTLEACITNLEHEFHHANQQLQ